MRVAVIGIGKMGLLHAGVLNALEGVELCALSDSSAYLLNLAKNLKPVAVYDDYRKMLDREKPDAAVIATPVSLHVPMGLECASRGIAFLMEKPLGLSSAEALPLVDRVRERRLVTMVGYMLRFEDTFRKGREVLASGALGKVITFSSTAYVSQLFRKGKGWRYSRQQSGGGVVIGQATHLLDLLRWYFGPVASVSAHQRSFYSEEVEDYAHGHLEFAGGVTGWFDSSWSIRHHRLLEIGLVIHGENGTLEVSDDEVKLDLDEPAAGFERGWTRFRKPDLFHGVTIDIGGAHYTRQDEAFAAAVRDNTPPESDVANAWEVQKLVDAVYRSAERRGEPVQP